MSDTWPFPKELQDHRAERYLLRVVLCDTPTGRPYRALLCAQQPWAWDGWESVALIDCHTRREAEAAAKVLEAWIREPEVQP